MSLIQRIRRRAGDDRGVTLAEMVVTTGILSVVMTIFTTAIVQLYRASNENTTVAVTQSQLNTAFIRLDRELRYARGISSPRPSGKDWYVEFVSTETSSGDDECAQLNLNAATRTLRRQVWQDDGPTGRWAVLANEINVDDSWFKLLEPGEAAGFQRLQIKLVVKTAPGSGQRTATSSITFTALNTTSGTDPDDVCKEARSTP
ncbi:Tfp pilus assembly protein FimT/FimU [Dactylosporangium sucinum]|nr:prepilin-type N-terminal cleavage/methylation domain-containing protein [Dactylosporangium sucinum]